MTEISRKTKQLATLCFSLFLLRLGFRAFGYDLFITIRMIPTVYRI